MKLTFLPRNRTFGFLDALGVAGLVGLLVARFVPVARLPFWGCMFRQVTGWPCPGCGLTRAADHLAHFHFGRALLANPLGTVAGALFAAAALYALAHYAIALPTPDLQMTDDEARKVRIVVIVALVTNYAFVILQTRVLHLG